MKNIFNYKSLLTLFVLGGIASSCTDDDLNLSKGVKPVVSITSQSATQITEGETVTISLTVNTPYKEDIDLKLAMVSGGSDDDYIVESPSSATSISDGLGSYGYAITFPAFASTHEFTIKSVKDFHPESSENYTFELTSSGNGNGLVLPSSSSISFDVENFVDDSVAILLEWDKDVEYDVLRQKVLATDADDEELVNEENLCDVVDFDVFLNGGVTVDAFTGDCPELIDVDHNNTQVLPDGSYPVIVDLWNFGLDLDDDPDVNDILVEDFAFPFTLTIAKTGQFEAKLHASDLFATNSVVSAPNTSNGNKLAATIVVTGGKYTILDANGDVVAAE